ncbi:hypothetical protein WSK_0983 [Novosphingobium sp. Rr 2-17]|uniref:hypothetical protein n=1 Tax=Novosphingobium sp. Rr 2-17 TaxID=555793 RepID=UPI000269981A|nr:hypothetical protein [Novosphingobium sp. Rr 2-17]EIZ80425.1 hypothetical protein WSK_0983 [Novosphingobium sp. Rr 2-17]
MDFFKAYGDMRLYADGAASDVLVVVSPEGKAVSCATVAVYGDKTVAARLCEPMMRATFKPASADNSPAWGAFSTQLKFFAPETERGRFVKNLKQSSDLELKVAALPTGLAGPVDIIATAQVSPQGAIGACVGRPQDNAALIKVACNQLRASSNYVLKSPDGLAQTYVRSFKVRFDIDGKTK